MRGGDGGQENDNSPRQRQQPRADGCGRGRRAARTGLDTNLAAVRGGDGGQENENSPRQRQHPRADGCGRQAARTAVRSEKTRCVDFHRRKEKLKRPRIGSRGGGCGRQAATRCLNNRTSLLCSDHSIGENSIYTLLNHNQSDLREGDTFFTFI